MKLFKEQLEEMSDFELNKALHLNILTRKPMKDLESITYKHGAFDVRFKSGANFLSHLKNYLHSYDDLMPLAIEHGIGILSEDGEIYGATTNTFLHYTPFPDAYAISFTSGKPQRDIACCLIMLLEKSK